jgi:hypothetical protein
MNTASTSSITISSSTMNTSSTTDIGTSTGNSSQSNYSSNGTDGMFTVESLYCEHHLKVFTSES